jgi:K+-sensing histidine kinase KdpD
MHEFWVVLAFATAFIIAQLLGRSRIMRAKTDAERAAERRDATDMKMNSQSAQGVCRRLAATLEVNAIIVERIRDEIIVVAGAPWRTEVEPLDKIALDWSFTTGLPPKSGNGNPFASDWLFLPVLIGGRVVAVLGVMARHGRRRFIADEQPSIRSAVAALERIYGSRRSQKFESQHLRSNHPEFEG